jgi:tRNA G18 (ribose-2'-O)-methylase SpoU
LNIINIKSLDQTGLEPYLTLRRPIEHFEKGIFVAEGEKVVRRLLASPLLIRSMLLTHDWYSKLEAEGLFGITEKKQFDIFIADKSVLETIVGFNLHQGIMAIAKVPAQESLEEMITKIPKPHLLIALDKLANSENVGVIVRNCTAFGVDGIIVGENSSSPYLRRAVRNSMGAVFGLPLVHSSNLVESLSMIKKNYSTKIIAAHLGEENSIHAIDLNGNICIVLGNEGEGISETILNACDVSVTIPMMNGTDSLNVASASAVFLYEASKQRNYLRK